MVETGRVATIVGENDAIGSDYLVVGKSGEEREEREEEEVEKELIEQSVGCIRVNIWYISIIDVWG